jgi:hypothetical protein
MGWDTIATFGPRGLIRSPTFCPQATPPVRRRPGVDKMSSFLRPTAASWSRLPTAAEAEEPLAPAAKPRSKPSTPTRQNTKPGERSSPAAMS